MHIKKKLAINYRYVKKVTRDHIVLDLGGNAEAILPRTEMIPHEAVAY